MHGNAWQMIPLTEGDAMEGYMERCRIEYEQLCDRLDKLDAMLDGYRDGTLGFEPSCPLDALIRQADAMREYKASLEARNEIERMW